MEFASAAVAELALLTNPRVIAPRGSDATASDAAVAARVPMRQRLTVRSLLLNTPLSAFAAPDKGVLTLNANVTAADGFQQLLTRGVQSAPVMPVPAEAPAPGTVLQPLGFFELSDAVRYVVDAYDRAEAIAVVSRAYDGKLNRPAHGIARSGSGSGSGSGTDSRHAGAEMKANTASAGAAIAAAAGGCVGSVNEVIDQLFAESRSGAAGAGANATVGQMCRHHPFLSLPRTASALDAAALLVGSGHRVCVTDEKGAVTNVLSQSDIVRFVYNNLQHIDEVERERNVDDWHCGTRPVRALETSARTIDVFRRMCDAKLSAVVLTDERGSYADLAQPSDLKLFLSLFTTPKPIAHGTGAVAAPAPALLSSAQFEAPISVVLQEMRQLELQKRIVKGSGSARLPLSVSSVCAPSFADVVTRLATSRSHVLCLTVRLDDALRAMEPNAPLQVPVMMCSLGDVLRAVLRWVPPTLAEVADQKRQRAFERALKAAEASKAASEAAAEADLADAAAAAASTDAVALRAAQPKGALASATAAADVKHSGSADGKEALKAGAAQLVTAPQGLSSALPPKPTAAAAPQPKPAPSQGVEYAQHSEAEGRATAFNACAHDGVAHWYSDHGHCLYATRTCARLHPVPPACHWADGSKFCLWDLGYVAGERIAREARVAAAKRTSDLSATRVELNAQLHAAHPHKP